MNEKDKKEKDREEQFSDEIEIESQGNELTINKELAEKCSALQKELAETKNKYLRSLADMDNYRKKVLKEKKEWEYIATSRILYKLLNLADDFERALKSIQETDSKEEIKKGIELIYKNLIDLLKGEHVHPFDSEGEKFDPAYHEAILMMETDEYEDGTIINEIAKGYKMKNSVLRPAKVVVSRMPVIEGEKEGDEESSEENEIENKNTETKEE